MHDPQNACRFEVEQRTWTMRLKAMQETRERKKPVPIALRVWLKPTLPWPSNDQAGARDRGFA